MKLSDWAENEVKYACERERKAGNPDEWGYGCACYESALKAFKSLMEDGHSGFSISITKNILSRLIDGKPLTPIEDIDEVWNEIPGLAEEKGSTKYQCKRMSALFKTVNADGTISYSDVDRVVFFDIGSDTPWSNGFVRELINDLYPITMPYIPPTNPYKVYGEDFLYKEGNGDFDTRSLLYLIDPNGERVELNKFYKEGSDGWIEIGETEYELRKGRYREVEE